MQIDKSQILSMLTGNGQHDTAAQADAQLPQTVDTDQPEHQNLLSSLGINMGSLSGLAGMAGGLGGLGGLMGGSSGSGGGGELGMVEGLAKDFL